MSKSWAIPLPGLWTPICELCFGGIALTQTFQRPHYLINALIWFCCGVFLELYRSPLTHALTFHDPDFTSSDSSSILQKLEPVRTHSVCLWWIPRFDCAVCSDTMHFYQTYPQKPMNFFFLSVLFPDLSIIWHSIFVVLNLHIIKHGIYNKLS